VEPRLGQGQITGDDTKTKRLDKPLVDATGKRLGKLGKRSDKNHAEHLIHLLDKEAERAERSEKHALKRRDGFKKHRENLRRIRELGKMVRLVERKVLPSGEIQSTWQ
jgi:hypothetical protein